MWYPSLDHVTEKFYEIKVWNLTIMHQCWLPSFGKRTVIA